jgi:hypothetical protein
MKIPITVVNVSGNEVEKKYYNFDVKFNCSLHGKPSTCALNIANKLKLAKWQI